MDRMAAVSDGPRQNGGGSEPTPAAVRPGDRVAEVVVGGERVL